LIVAGAAAYAGESRDSPTDESRALSSAKISMSQALTAAELATGGKAVGTGVEDQDGDVHFEVTILKDNVRQKVLVDTQTGQVVKIVLADDGDEGGSEN
jgi:uncharacterized membrane protein YkoI